VKGSLKSSQHTKDIGALIVDRNKIKFVFCLFR
jgi:hypothetical protein